MIIETVVCSVKDGYSARLQRLLESRRVLRNSTRGCLASWVAKGLDNQTYLIQSVFRDEKSCIASHKKIQTKLDPKDGGLEPILSGPPLVGIFEIEADDWPFA